MRLISLLHRIALCWAALACGTAPDAEAPPGANPVVRYRYTADQVRWGARHADMLSERPDGRMQLDMGKFHRTVATAPTAEFPYPRERSGDAEP